MMKHGKSLFFSYVISYLGIVILACSAIALPLIILSFRELDRYMKQTVQIRLGNASADLEGQFNIMNDIAARVSVSAYFKSSYLKTSEINKLETLKYFSYYKDYSSFYSDYFYYRLGDELVWKPNAVNTVDTYVNNYLWVEDPENFKKFINDINDISIYFLNVNSVIIIFPLRVNVLRTQKNDAIMGFIVNVETIIHNIKKSALGFDSLISVYLKKKPFISFDINGIMIESEILSDYSNFLLDNEGKISDKTNPVILGAASPNNIISIVSDSSKLIAASYIGFRLIIALIIIFAITSISFIGYLLAKRNYKPILDLVRTYANELPDNSNINELNQINYLMSTALDKNKLSENQINEQGKIIQGQKDMLTQQLFLMILNGEGTSKTYLNTENLGIHFPGDIFTIFLVNTIKDESEEKKQIFRIINELSDNDLLLYCVALKNENYFVVIANTDDYLRLSEAEELIDEILRTKSIKFTIHRGITCEKLEKLPLSLASVISRTLEKQYSEKISKQSHAFAIQLTNILFKNNIELIHSKFNELINAIENEELSFLQQYHIFAEILLTIQRETDEYDVPYIREKISKLLLSNTIDQFHEGVSTLLDEIHLIISDNERIKQQAMQNQIVKYIRDHALEYDMDYTRLSDKFNISPKILRQTIKNETGNSLRDTLNTIRIEEACKLLIETNKPVNDISKNVGFLSDSYFIKIFRSLKYLTPYNYRIQNAVFFEKKPQIHFK